MSSFREIKF